MNYFLIKEKNNVTAVVCDNGISFSCDEANTDYQAYLAWVAEGNTAEEWTGN
jgi:hypothetical protein